jgi:hypothetical protein
MRALCCRWRRENGWGVVNDNDMAWLSSLGDLFVLHRHHIRYAQPAEAAAGLYVCYWSWRNLGNMHGHNITHSFSEIGLQFLKDFPVNLQNEFINIAEWKKQYRTTKKRWMLPLMLHSRNALDSYWWGARFVNLAQNIDYPDRSPSWFSSVTPGKFWDGTSTGPWPLPSKIFQLMGPLSWHHSTLIVYLLIYQSIYGSPALVDLLRFLSFLVLYTVGMTPWMGDQPVASPLPTHRINAHRHRCLEWDANHDPGFQAAGEG